MTMKSQVTFSELQERWKEILLEIDRCIEVIEEAFVTLTESLKPLLELITNAFETFKEHYIIEDDRDIPRFSSFLKSYPQSYPQNVNNFKLNKHGFPQDIKRCSRSRC